MFLISFMILFPLFFFLLPYTQMGSSTKQVFHPNRWWLLPHKDVCKLIFRFLVSNFIHSIHICFVPKVLRFISIHSAFIVSDMLLLFVTIFRLHYDKRITIFFIHDRKIKIKLCSLQMYCINGRGCSNKKWHIFWPLPPCYIFFENNCFIEL